MKAPDKIYMHLTPHLELLAATTIPVNAPDEEEYIRKDALLKVLEDTIAHLSDWSLTGYYESLAYQDIIKKINSL